MRKNKLMALVIMVIVVVILTNFDKTAEKTVYDSNSIEERSKRIDYKFLKFSYQDDTDSSCLKAVDEVIKNLPVEVVTGILDDEIEIRIMGKENADYYYETDGANTISTCRKYNLSIALIYQNKAQIEVLFEKK